MEELKKHLNTIIIAVAAIICFAFLANAYKYRFKQTENIKVTGSAEKEFESDQIIWGGFYNKMNFDLRQAYSDLRKDENLIRQYLKTKGINENEYNFSAITIEKIFDEQFANGQRVSSVFQGYKLVQQVNVDSKDISKVEKLSRESTELIEKGVEFNSNSPQYFYSKLSEIKHELLAKATADARKRAEIIASNANSSLGKLLNATMGVFQIQGVYADDQYSYGGVLNTSSKVKKAYITVKVDIEAK